jgi:polyhydroxybutyrate depolymerase
MATSWVRALVGVLTLVGLLATTACRPDARSPDGGTRPASRLPDGSSAQVLTVDEVRRTYRVYVPTGVARSTPAPLVIMLHGGFGSGAQAESAYGWNAKADAEHFVVAYPDGIDRAWSVGGGCCGSPARDGVDDVGFIRHLVTALRQALSIDANRVFATGISNGGMLAYRLACDTAIFAAIGPDSATLLGSCPSPAPISVIHIHGTADRNIPYDGGRGEGIAHIDGPAVPSVVQTWRQVDGCAPPSVQVAGAVTTSVATCPQGRTVELVTIAGGGHQWPGAARGLDPPSGDLDATGTIWRFFASHPSAT